MKLLNKLTILLVVVMTLTACFNQAAPSDHYADGQDYLENYQYSLALEQFKLAINDKPANPDAYLAAADILIAKGSTEEAKELLVLAIEQAEPLAEIQERLGMIYLDEGKYQEALDYVNSGLDISPNYEKLIVLKINALSLLDQLGERENYLKDLNDDKLSQEMLLVKGIILYEDQELALQVLDEAKKGDNTQVAEDANSVIEIINAIALDEEALFNKTQLAFQLLSYDYFEVALPLANQIIEDNEYYETGYLYKGICHLRINQLDVAVSNLEQSLTLNPSSVEARIFLVEAYLRSENIEAVESNVNAVLPSLSVNNKDRILELATLLYSYNQHTLTKTVIERAILDDTTLEINLLWVKNLVELEEYSRALSHEELLNDSFDLYTTSQQAEIKAYLGFAKYNTDQKAEGLELVKDAQLIDRTYAMAYYFEGVILFNQEELNTAKEALERAIDLDTSGNSKAQELLSQI